jgi:hypothetical protein
MSVGGGAFRKDEKVAPVGSASDRSANSGLDLFSNGFSIAVVFAVNEKNLKMK